MLLDLESIVLERLNGHSKCAGHCEEQTKLKLLHQNGMLIGCYICPSGYVSLIVQYGKKLQPPPFNVFLSSLSQDNVTDEDIRIGTRYNWDLGVDEADGPVLQEAYWRQNYRRTKDDDPSRLALFLCSKCSSFYQRQLSEKNDLCPRCEESATMS